MTDQALAECRTLLRLMPSTQPWEDGHRTLYDMVLRNMTDEEGRSAVEFAAEHESWRPAPARLREIAVNLASPLPDADACYDEIAHLAETVGLYGACLPERPSIRVPGPPTFSHPIVARIVNYCGGWAMICSGEANMAEGLRKQVRSSWESVARDWRERVGVALKLPPAQRDPTLFGPFQPYRLPVGWAPMAELPATDELPQYDADKRGGGLTRFGS